MDFKIKCEKCLHKEVCKDKNKALKLQEKLKDITKGVLGDFEIKVGCRNFLETAPIESNQIWTYQGQYWCGLKQRWCSRTGYLSECYDCPYKSKEWAITWNSSNSSEIDNPNSSSYCRMEDLYKSGIIHPTGENKDAL